MMRTVAQPSLRAPTARSFDVPSTSTVCALRIMYSEMRPGSSYPQIFVPWPYLNHHPHAFLKPYSCYTGCRGSIIGGHSAWDGEDGSSDQATLRTGEVRRIRNAHSELAAQILSPVSVYLAAVQGHNSDLGVCETRVSSYRMKFPSTTQTGLHRVILL